MTQVLTDIQIPSDVEQAIHKIHQERKKLSAISVKSVLGIVEGYSKTDIQIYITLYKANYKPIDHNLEKLNRVKEAVELYSLSSEPNPEALVSTLGSILSE